MFSLGSQLKPVSLCKHICGSKNYKPSHELGDHESTVHSKVTVRCEHFSQNLFLTDPSKVFISYILGRDTVCHIQTCNEFIKLFETMLEELGLFSVQQIYKHMYTKVKCS